MKAPMLALACGLALAAAMPAAAQHAGHHPPGHAAPAPVKKAAPVRKPAAKAPAAKKPAAKATPTKKAATKKPAAAPRAAAKPVPKPARPAAARDAAAMDHGGMDHSAMDHGAMHDAHAGHHAAGSAKKPESAAGGHDHAATGHTAMDHAAMHDAHAGHHAAGSAKKPGSAVGGHDHAAMDDTAMDHAAMQDAHAGHHAAGASKKPEGAAASHDHAGMHRSGADHAGMHHAAPGAHMDHAAMDHAAPELPADAAPRTPIPAITDADRAAAFPDASGHAAHDRAIHSYWLADRLEWQDTDEGTLAWEGLAWIGGDVHRAWLRTEGEAEDGDVDHANVEVLYGRAVTAWWDVVAGVRHDFGEGPSRTWAAFGVQGLAPYKFEGEATAYVGDGGRTAASLEAEYDTLVTNRLVLQWVGEATLHGRDDPARGIGSGLSTVEAGARLRYEVTRRCAPYVGVEWERAFGETADLRRDDGHAVEDTRLVAGIRFWF